MPSMLLRALRYSCLVVGGLAACEDALVPVRNGVGSLPLNTVVAITAPSDRGVTYRVQAPPGSGVYLEVTALAAEARVFGGLAGDLAPGASLGFDPLAGSGTLRSATFPVSAAGEAQVALTAAIPGGTASLVQIRAVVDATFDARIGRGQIIPGVVYGAGSAECESFGYLVTTTDTLLTISSRANTLAPTSIGVAAIVPGAPLPTLLLAAFAWAPMPGASPLDLDNGATDAIRVAAGRWLIAMCSKPVPARFRVTLHTTGPEHVSAAVAVGDTVTGEAIDVPGDVDDFMVTSFPGDSIVLAIAGGSPALARLQVQVPPGNLFFGIGAATTVDATQPLLATVTAPLYVGASGVLSFRVTGLPGLFQHNAKGSYRVAVMRAPSQLPETASSALVVGDSVLSETLFIGADVDRFTLTATPGAPFTVELRKIDGVGAPSLVSLAINSPLGAIISGALTSAAGGVLRLPVTPTFAAYAVVVSSPDRSFFGRYALRILPGIVP